MLLSEFCAGLFTSHSFHLAGNNIIATIKEKNSEGKIIKELFKGNLSEYKVDENYVILNIIFPEEEDYKVNIIVKKVH